MSPFPAAAPALQRYRAPAGPWYEAHTRLLPAHHHAGLVTEFAHARRLQLPALPGGGTGPLLTPRDLLDHLGALLQADGGADTAFALGQIWWPGHYGAASHALGHAGTLAQALDLLVQQQRVLSPLLSPRWLRGQRQAVVWWQDACGAPALRNRLVELHMSALASLCAWLGGRPLPWTFCLNRAAPREPAHHQVHLGPRLRFGCQLDAMLIGSHWLDQPWPRGSGPAAAAAQAALPASPGGVTRSLLAALYDHLIDALVDNHNRAGTGSLEDCAAALGVSPATLKRQLARHGSHFQAERDQARAHYAIFLYQQQGLDSDAVAQRLGIPDRTNFRRAVRRWTGLTPRLLAAALGG